MYRGRQRGTRKSLSFLVSFFLPGRGNKEVDPLLKKTESRQYRTELPDRVPEKTATRFRNPAGQPRTRHPATRLEPVFLLIIQGSKDQNHSRALEYFDNKVHQYSAIS